jgi:hypothetical protein
MTEYGERAEMEIARAKREKRVEEVARPRQAPDRIGQDAIPGSH